MILSIVFENILSVVFDFSNIMINKTIKICLEIWYNGIER